MSIILNRTPTAELIGDATMAESTTGSTDSDKAGTSVPSGKASGEPMNAAAGTNEASVVVTTPANSLVVVTASMSSINDSTPADTHNIRVLDGSTTLKSASVLVGNNTDRLLSVLFVGIPLSGSRTYNVQTWSPGGGILLMVTINVTHIQLTDTHAGVGKKVNNIIKG